MTVIVKRLANKKTRRETGLDYVTTGLNLLTPFGSGLIKEQKPFLPGQEELLRAELSRIQEIKSIADGEGQQPLHQKKRQFGIVRSRDFRNKEPAFAHGQDKRPWGEAEAAGRIHTG